MHFWSTVLFYFSAAKLFYSLCNWGKNYIRIADGGVEVNTTDLCNIEGMLKQKGWSKELSKNNYLKGIWVMQISHKFITSLVKKILDKQIFMLNVREQLPVRQYHANCIGIR